MKAVALFGGTFLLLLSACGDRTPAENAATAIDNKADDVRQAGDNMADGIEEQAAALEGSASNAMENKAAGVRDDAENKADAMEDKADKVRDGESR